MPPFIFEKMEYFKNLRKYHETAGAILEKIIAEKKTIESLEESQNNYKRIFGETNPQFAFDVLVANRKIKMLTRGYNKIMQQINL